MSKEILFERDILYPTGNINEPGCVHLKIYGPDKSAMIPVALECKTNHSAVKYFDTIVRIMQSDIFDRIFVDIKKNVIIYIKTQYDSIENGDGKQFTKVVYVNDKFEFINVDEIGM